MTSKNKTIDKLSLLLNASDKRRNRNKLLSKVDHQVNKIVTVMAYFEKMSAAEISIFHKRIVKNIYFKDLPLIKRKSEASDFFTGLIPDTSLEKSISYILAAITDRKDELNYFLIKESEISLLIINGDYKEAKILINDIYEKFGHSLWYYTLTSTIADLEGDYDSKEEILRPVLESDKHIYFRFVVRNLSSRHDYTGAFLQNINSFKGSLQTFSSKMAEHFIFRLTPLDYSYKYDFEAIFNEEKNTSLVDAYKSLINYLLYQSYKDPHLSEINTGRIVSTLANNTDCQISKQLNKIIAKKSNWVFHDVDYDILDNYTYANYDNVCNMISSTPTLLISFPIFELYTKCLERKDLKITLQSELVNEVVKSLSSIYKKDNEYVKSYNHLLSLCFSFEGISWFTHLSLLVLQEDRFSEGQIKLQCLYNLISPIDSPQKSLHLSDDKGNDLIDAAINKFPNSSCLSLYKKIRNQELITKDILDNNTRRNKYNAIVYLTRKDYPSAIELLKSSLLNLDRLSENEYSELLGKCYLLSGATSEAVTFAMDKIINNRSLIPLFNVREMCKRIKQEINSLNNIHIPNFLSIYTRYIDDEFKPSLRYSLESFFKKNNLLTMDQLLQNKNSYDLSQLYYFLEYVCVPDLMKLTTIFYGTKKTETNRIKACSFLLENNKSEAISEELKTLVKRQVLNIASKQVDHSKIFADASKLRTQDNSGLNELYQQLLKHRAKDYSNNAVERALKKVLKEIVKPHLDDAYVLNNIRDIYLINNIQNEKNDIFEKLFMRIRDEFVFGSNGLNINLSTRIRHGHFPSTLRKSLVDEGLITTQIEDSSEFKTNEYWMSLLKFDCEDDYNKADISFKNFSKSYEAIIAEANNDWFQVRIFSESFNKLLEGEVKSKRLALFDYSITIVELYYIQTVYASYSSYSDFIKTIIDWLWNKTDHNLVKIRQMINITLRAKVFNEIRTLQHNIYETIKDETVTHEFNNAIGRCKESLNINLETISSWFMRNEQAIIDPYEFDTVVEISRRAADTSVETEIPVNLKFKGKTLSSFVDVLYMIFENAKTKSYINKDELNLKISLTVNPDFSAVLKIINSCKDVDDITLENNNLDEYREKYLNYKDHLTIAQGEGNTGLIKIAKILHQDLELEHAMNIGYVEHSQFEIKFNFANFSRVIDNADTYS
ncbi:hypothetical protein [Pantoea agglomerans]|uniref:hypothetical protein n=1 Tax=Enterobacter agglomerans TaxID=549 RepID=UPI003C7D68A5